MSERERAAIGLDLGTSGIKAIALGESGRVLARARQGYRSHRPTPGAAEQDPQDWWNAALAVLSEVAEAVYPDTWTSIGLSAMLPTLVSLDRNNRPVGPAVTWEDARAEPEGEEFRARHGRAELYRMTGQLVDGRYLLPMHARRAALAAEGQAGVDKIVGAKDYLFWLLTGELLTDPSTATGYGAYDLLREGWDPSVLRESSFGAALPEIVSSREYRPLLPALAAELGCAPGLPVVVGAADSVLGAYGLGVSRPGDVAYIAGTSTVIIGRSEDPVLDDAFRCLLTPMADSGFGLEMDLLSTGSSVAWLAGVFGLGGGAPELAALAEDVSVNSAPTVLPYLAPGEQGALWDNRLQGVFHGLSLSTTREEIARGLFTGIVVESRRCLSVLDEMLPDSVRHHPVMVTGSSAASPAFRQDLADASGRPVTYFARERDHSGIGAALLAGRATEGWETVPVLDATTIVPNPVRAALWEDIAARHDGLRIASLSDQNTQNATA